MPEIITEVQALANQGVKEVTLLGQIVDRYGLDLQGSPDFVKIAEAYGLEGRFVADIDALMQALLYAREADHSVLIRVAVEPESNIEPMIPPGGKVTDFCGYCISKPGQFFTEGES